MVKHVFSSFSRAGHGWLALGLLLFSTHFGVVLTHNALFAQIQPQTHQDYVYGAVIGAALGDALGRPVEFISSQAAIRQRYPDQLTNFADFKRQDFWVLDHQTRAAYTDDTQMALCVLEVFTKYLEAFNQHDFSQQIKYKAMSDLARRFVEWSLDPDGGLCADRAPGRTCLRGCKELKELSSAAPGNLSDSWWERAQLHPERIEIEGGSGGVMRVWPIGLVLAYPDRGLDQTDLIEYFAVSQSKMTHRHPKSLAASAAIAVGIFKAVRVDKLMPTEVAQSMIASARRYDQGTADLMSWAYWQALDPNSQDEQVLDRLQSWAADEAAAAALYIYLKYPNDLGIALKVGANTTGDSDTIATLAGALVGACAGINALGYFPMLERLEKIEHLGLLAHNLYLKQHHYLANFFGVVR